MVEKCKRKADFSAKIRFLSPNRPPVGVGSQFLRPRSGRGVVPVARAGKVGGEPIKMRNSSDLLSCIKGRLLHGLVEKPGIIKERPDTTCTKFKWSILMYFDPLNPILALVCRCRFILKSYGRKTTENQSKITPLANSAADFVLHSLPTTL